MSFAAFVAFAPFFLKDDDFLSPLVFKDLGLHGSAFDEGCPERGFAVVDEHEHFVNIYDVALCRFRETVYKELVALLYGELTTLGLNSGFHFAEKG